MLQNLYFKERTVSEEEKKELLRKQKIDELESRPLSLKKINPVKKTGKLSSFNECNMHNF